MKLTDFYYDLPKELIAQHPAEPRDHARLMLYDRQTGAVEHKYFYDLVDELHQATSWSSTIPASSRPGSTANGCRLAARSKSCS